MAEDEVREKKAKKRGGRVATLTSERKRRKKEYNQKLAGSRIYIGGAIEKWKSLQQQTKTKTDEEMATMLLERFENEAAFKEPQSVHTSMAMKTSTPAASSIISRLKNKEYDRTPSMSEISADSEQEPMSGVEELQVSGPEDPGTRKKITNMKPTAEATPSSRSRKPKKWSDSFCDPLNLSIDISVQDSDLEAVDSEEDDPNYQPSFDVTAILPDDVNSMAEDVAYEEVEFGFELPGNDGQLEGPDIEMGVLPGVHRVSTEGECRDLTTALKCIAFVDQIKELTKIHVPRCTEQSCNKPTQMKESYVGSALHLKWICEEGHVSHHWCSQPQLNRRLHSGDFLICGSILTSGNNYGKLALWAEMLKLKFPSADQFHRICSTYVIPTIDKFWSDHRQELLNDFKDKEVVVLGDGRNDSPGHCAQYCSYTLMDNETKKILTIETLDKRMTDRKSVNMEKAGFQIALNDLLEKDIKVVEVVTDAHLGIGSVMKKGYPNIHHSHDIWHVAKNLGKKILKVAQKKGNNILLDWCKDIINHFWFSCRRAESYEEFMGIWRSVLHHITDTHEWILSHGGVNHCLHGELGEEERTKPWLSPTKHAHVLKDLAAVVLNKRLLNNVGYYLRFRSTAELEGFHQHILMYCSKRHAYTPPVYRARNRLAALDHNMNSDRPVQKNKDGKIRYHRVFNKKKWEMDSACHEGKEKI